MATQQNANTLTSIIIGPARFSYLHALEPKAAPGGKPKYSVSLLIPKTDVAMKKRIDEAINAAIQVGLSKWGGKKPVKLKLPVRDGDLEKDDEVYAGHWFINASSDNKPGFVDAKRQPILDEDEIYSGMYGRASVNFYAFDTNGNKGIACGLNNLQKLKDGENLIGRKKAENDFDDEFIFSEDDDLA